MQETFEETNFLRWRRAFPWLHLLRVPGIAFRMQILFAGFLAGLFSLVCYLFEINLASYSGGGFILGTTSGEASHVLQHGIFVEFVNFSQDFVAPNRILLSVFVGLGSGYPYLLSLDGMVLIANFLFQLLFGIIICRMACSEFTKGNGISLKQASGFAAKKLPTVLTGFLFPLVTIAVLVACTCAVLATESIPVVGEVVFGILYGVSILLMFLTIVLIGGLVVGWPMIVAVIACENSDSFDAWSRSFDYLRSRLIPILIAFAVTMTVGVFIFICLVEVTQLSYIWLDRLQGSILGIAMNELQAHNTMGFQPLWKVIWAFLLNGYLTAFYWCTISAIYILVRHSVDRVPIDEFQQS